MHKTHTTDFVTIDVFILAPTPVATADSAHITIVEQLAVLYDSVTLITSHSVGSIYISTYIRRQAYIHFTLFCCPHSHPHVPVHNRNLAHMECMGVLTVHQTLQEDEFACYVSLPLACL